MSHDELARLEALAARGLDVVLRWGWAQTPPLEVVEVVVQDEFTHDVVMRWRGDRHLVFDTT